MSHLEAKKFLAQSHGQTHKNTDTVSSGSSESIAAGRSRSKLLRENVRVGTQREHVWPNLLLVGQTESDEDLGL